MTTTRTLPTAKTSGVPTPTLLESPSETAQIQGRLVLLYGESGLGKSTEGKRFAKYIYELTGLPTRLISFEDSGKLVYEPLINLGIVDAVWMSKAKYPFTALRKLAEGLWPKGGEFRFVYVDKEIGGKKVSVLEDQTEYLRISPGEVGGYIFEGLASGGESLLEFGRENHLFLREQEKDSITIGGIKLAAPSQTLYNVVQMDILSAIKGLGMLPVERVLLTSHEYKGEDEDTGKPLRGPAVVGKAMTGKIMKYVGLQLHYDAVKSADGKQIQERRVYFERHPDPLFPNLFYPAKTTIPTEQLARLSKQYPNGFFKPGLEYGTGLDQFLRFESELVNAQTNLEAEWKAQIDLRRNTTNAA